MALLYRADLRPTKLELLATWLPGRPWYAGPAGAELTRVSACRFDDPAGEVGIETMLVRAGAEGADVPAVTAVRQVADGDPTVVSTDSVELRVVRIVGGHAAGGATLTATWAGQPDPALLAYLT